MSKHRTYYAIKRKGRYDEIVKSHGIRTVRHVIYSEPDAHLIISIKKAKNDQVKNYLQRTGKTVDQIRAINKHKLWYHKNGKIIFDKRKRGK